MEAIEQGGIEALNNNPYGGVDLMTVMCKPITVLPYSFVHPLRQSRRITKRHR